jgi:hypothetical protein
LADSKTIIPPFLELDRNHKNNLDLLATYILEAIESFTDIKKYFPRISPCKEDGSVRCHLTLAQSVSFPDCLEKTRHSLENHGFSLWPKASDNKFMSKVGWLLFSTHQQDEARLAELSLSFQDT